MLKVSRHHVAVTAKVAALETVQEVVMVVVQEDVEKRVTDIVTISALIIAVTNVRELVVALVAVTVLELVPQIAVMIVYFLVKTVVCNPAVAIIVILHVLTHAWVDVLKHVVMTVTVLVFTHAKAHAKLCVTANAATGVVVQLLYYNPHI